jgi:hypothetical protein
MSRYGAVFCAATQIALKETGPFAIVAPCESHVSPQGSRVTLSDPRESLGTSVATCPIHPVRKVADGFAANIEWSFAGVIRTLAKANRVARRDTLVALAGAS